MAINFTVSKANLPVAHDVCFKLTGPNTFYVILATGLHLAGRQSLSGDRAGRDHIAGFGARSLRNISARWCRSI